MTTKEYIEELKKEAKREEIRALATNSPAERRTHIEQARKKKELRSKLQKIYGGIRYAVRTDCLKAM